MKIINKCIKSERQTDIPVTIVEADSFPSRLLICVHGFKANRTEDGRFLEVAEALAPHGYSSIMMGFPGCDESREDFYYYTLNNCLDDIDSSYEYMKKNYDIDNDNVSMIGYSMGARLVAIYSNRHPEIKCICFWAGATFEAFDNNDDFLGESIIEMKKQIEDKGYIDFYNSFDDEYLKMNKDFIYEMENISVRECLNDYMGSALIVHGDKDITVFPRIARETYDNLTRAKNKKLYIVKGADHGFGEWNRNNKLSKQLTEVSIEYILNKSKE